MSIFLDRINPAPVNEEELPFEFMLWLSVMLDSMNENLNTIETAFNELAAPNITQAELIALAPNISDGRIFYVTDHAPPVPAMKVNGAIVQLVTAPFP